MSSEAANAFILHAGVALHESGFCGQMHPAHSAGWLRVYAGKDDSGFVCLRMREERAEDCLRRGDLIEKIRHQARFVDRLWEIGYRKKLPAEAIA